VAVCSPSPGESGIRKGNKMTSDFIRVPLRGIIIRRDDISEIHLDLKGVEGEPLIAEVYIYMKERQPFGFAFYADSGEYDECFLEVNRFVEEITDSSIRDLIYWERQCGEYKNEPLQSK
jgi:hypothetical protein